MKRVVVAAAAGAAVLAGIWIMAKREGASATTIAPSATSGGRAGGYAGYGWSVAPETVTAVNEALSHAGLSSDNAPDLTLVFYSHEHPPEAIIDAFDRAAGRARRVWGWSSWQGVATPDGHHTSPGGVVGVLSLRLPGVILGLGEAGFDETDSPAASTRLAYRRAAEDAGKVAAGGRPAMILMTCTYDGHEEQILTALDDAAGDDVPVMGGTAAESDVAHGSIIAERTVLRHGLAVCVLYSSLPIGWCFRGGFYRTGMSGVVTASEGRVIHEIDSRPALDVYDEWSGGRIKEAMRLGNDMNTFTGLYPLCRTFSAGRTTYNLFTHAWTPADAALSKRLVTSATVSKGDVVYFSEGSWNILLNHIGHLPRPAREQVGQTSVAAALLICCEAVLKNIPPDQRGQMSHLMNTSLGDVPWIGTFTWGEQGNFPGVGNRHGNLLTGVVVFPAANAGGA